MSLGNVRLDTHVLDAIARSLDKDADQVLESAAFQVEAEAKKRAPRDPTRPPKDPTRMTTGALRGGIITVKKKTGLYWVQDSVEYGIYQELGTSRMIARPFMVPAVEAVGRYIYKLWQDFIR